jgi:hypothetical protein
VNTSFEQSARYGAMGFSGDSEANRVYVSGERLPVSRRISLEFVADCARALSVDVTDADKLRDTLSSKRRVDARVLSAQVSDADYCSS